MAIEAGRTIKDLAVENPESTRVFEALGIDYCCGGKRPVEEACAHAGISVDELQARIEAVIKDSASRNDRDKNWASRSISDLVNHVVTTHHAYVRNEIPRITALLEKIGAKHGERHPELFEVKSVFAGLAAELTVHMMKEEQVLFPYLVRMEEAVLESEPAPPAMFGSIEHPIHMMMFEHDSAGVALGQLKELTGGYIAPSDGCTTYAAAYRALAEFEADLHQHIHLENNILFPRAIEMSREG